MTTLSLRLRMPDLNRKPHPTEVVRSIIVGAMYDAMVLAEEVSPIKSGRLRAGWVVRRTDKGAVLVNETPYANYVYPGKGQPPISRWPIKRDVAVAIGEALERRKDEVAAAFAAGAFGGVEG